MPITGSAKKALRVSARKKMVNDRVTKNMKEAVKAVTRLSKDGKKVEAKKALSLAQKALDKAAKNGVIKKNAASRKKSRLSKAIK